MWGVWHVDGRVKVARDASLPPRCIRCNRSTSYRVKYNAYWHPRGYYFFLLLGFWPYLLAYLLARRRFAVSVPLCADHELARRNRVGLAVCLSGGGFALMAIGMSVSALDVLTVVGFPAFAIGCVTGLRALRILKPTQITPEALYARGVCAEYLNRLPVSAG